MNLNKWEREKKKKMRNRTDWQRVWNLFVCLHVYLGSREEIPITFLCAWTQFPPHRRLQPWPDLGLYLTLSLEVLWAVVKLLFVAGGEVSREAESLREKRHLISTQSLACQRLHLCALCDLEYYSVYWPWKKKKNNSSSAWYNFNGI